ncbi:hypothetical protein T310_10316, partial [Rasamsonia emersonii CBS 393.64]
TSCLVLLLQRLKQLGRRLLSVSLRVVPRPAPEVLTRLFERPLGLPAQLLVRPRRVRRQVQHVTRTARSNLVWQVTAHRGREGADHLVDSAATASTQVPGANTRLVRTQVVER